MRPRGLQTGPVPERPPRRRDRWRSDPHPSRLPVDAALRATVLDRHARALDAGRPTYVDPVTGFDVFTADHLAGRGSCCDSGCRHCPYVGAEGAVEAVEADPAARRSVHSDRCP